MTPGTASHRCSSILKQLVRGCAPLWRQVGVHSRVHHTAHQHKKRHLSPLRRLLLLCTLSLASDPTHLCLSAMPIYRAKHHHPIRLHLVPLLNPHADLYMGTYKGSPKTGIAQRGGGCTGR